MLYPIGGPLGSDASWGMFALSGNPAYYLLYKNLNGADILNPDNQDGMTEEEKQRR